MDGQAGAVHLERALLEVRTRWMRGPARESVMRVVLDPAERSRRTFDALAHLVERTTPWLVAVGSWVFGGLIALNLVWVAALITVGPVDRAVLLAVVAFALALPFDVAEVVLLRLTKDLPDVRIGELALEAFQEARFPDIERFFPPAPAQDSLSRRRARLPLAYALVIAVLCVALTLTGLAASLWHMAPWAGKAFLGAVAISALVLVTVAARSLPPPSEAEQALKRREPRR